MSANRASVFLGVLVVAALAGCSRGMFKGEGGGDGGGAGTPTGGAGPGGGAGGSATGGAGPEGGAGGSGNPTGGAGPGGGGSGGGTGRPDASTEPPPADPCTASGTCPPNTWVNVTPMGITIPPEGLRSVVADPLRPADFYMSSGAAGVWKSSDYGNQWKLINKGFGYVAQGLCLTVLPSQPAATLLIGAACACGRVHKSTDGGATFRDAGGGLPGDLYSFQVDPYDGKHILSGFHEKDGIAESTDGGETWKVVGTGGFPSGGVSWYPYFIDTGAPETTAKTWIAIAQNGGSPTVTRNGGAAWTVPDGSKGLIHPHGNAQIFQRGSSIFIGGDNGPAGGGIYRSTDHGATFSKVGGNTKVAVVWGTPSHVYSMYAWSCFGCPIDPNFMVGSANGDTWTTPGVPKTMLMGADHVAVSSDGKRYIFVAAMRSSGLWRFVEE